MKQGVIDKQDLGKLIEALQGSHRFFAPVRAKGKVSPAQVASAEGIELDYFNLTVSPKELFFPQREIICSFDGDGVRETAPGDEGAFVVFGVRPCDARALLMLDKVFGGDIPDPYYTARRNSAVIISRACTEPAATCFCTALQGGPCDTAGSDIIAFDLGKSFLLEAVSAKGEDIMNACSGVLRKPSADDEKARKAAAAKAERHVAALDTARTCEALDGLFDDALWDAVQQPCLGCGACTYLCPTCHCFVISDRSAGSEGVRTRSWDSCQYPSFTMEASGHNPRPSGRERMRQRIMHKFNYFVKNFGEKACVGCGRCVENCPVNLDLREVIGAIGKAA
jgi:sulfhydrogenase subunit beta (sulfur reductase)